MRFGSTLGRDFFVRPCLEVAPELVGMILVRRDARGRTLAGRIVEVEAYLGEGRDAASHAHRGPTPRNRSMFGPPGRLYVYRSYGIHLCANLVCEEEGHGAAVLLRAIEPLAGEGQMRRNRGLAPEAAARLIAAGPGRLTQALALSLEDDGITCLRGPLTIRQPGPELAPLTPLASPRIGITKATSSPYRFCADQSRFLSKPALTPR